MNWPTPRLGRVQTGDHTLPFVCMSIERCVRRDFRGLVSDGMGGFYRRDGLGWQDHDCLEGKPSANTFDVQSRSSVANRTSHNTRGRLTGMSSSMSETWNIRKHVDDLDSEFKSPSG